MSRAPYHARGGCHSSSAHCTGPPHLIGCHCHLRSPPGPGSRNERARDASRHVSRPLYGTSSPCEIRTAGSAGHASQRGSRRRKCTISSSVAPEGRPQRRIPSSCATPAIIRASTSDESHSWWTRSLELTVQSPCSNGHTNTPSDDEPPGEKF